MAKIGVIWDWHVPPEEALSDRQAKLQAWRELGSRHYVTLMHMCEGYAYATTEIDGMWYRGFSSYKAMLDELLHGAFDALISWGSIDRPIHNILLPYRDRIPPVVFQFAGGPHDGDELGLFGKVVTQNVCDQLEFEERGFEATAIFGVDKEFWCPDPIQEKTIEVLYPASFCAHKGNDLVANKYSKKAIFVGKHDDLSLVDYCRSMGSLVLPPVTHTVLRDLYRASKKVSIGAIAGSQRTIVEAQACGVEVELLNRANYKCLEVLDGHTPVLGIKEMANEYERILLK